MPINNSRSIGAPLENLLTRLDLASERIATGITGAYAHEVMP